MQCPQYVVYTPAILRLHTEVWYHSYHCYQGLWVGLNQTQITKANKMLPCTVCVSLQTPTFVRAGQAWSAPRFRSARACGCGSPFLSWSTWTPKCFSSRTQVAQGGQSILGSFFNIQLKLQLKPTSIKPKSSSDTNIVWVWLVESTIAMGDIYVLCMLCSTVMLTTLFHLAIIIYLIYKFFN